MIVSRYACMRTLRVRTPFEQHRQLASDEGHSHLLCAHRRRHGGHVPPKVRVVAAGLGLMLVGQSRPSMNYVETNFLAGYLTLAGASTVFSMGLSPAYKGILPKTAFATMMSAYKASVDVGKIPGPRWSNFVQQHLDNEYIAYVPLIVAFSLIAAFVVAGRPFLTRPYAATTKVGAAESC